MEQRITAQLAALKAQREQAIGQVNYLTGAIAALEALLKPEPEAQPAKESA